MLFDVGSGLHFQYQGIFDTDFDKYLEDAVALFIKTGITTVFVNLEGWPEDWKTNLPAVIKFFRDHQRPSFLEYGEYPVRDGRRSQEGAAAEGGLFVDARRNAVMAPEPLEFDDIQHILLARVPALTGRYDFLSFRDGASGRRWLSAILEKVHSAAAAAKSLADDARWVTVAFTWHGLRALGVDGTSLATFPDAFQQGMAARASILGDTGANHPDHWVGGLASPDLHAIAILFARSER